MLNRAYRERRLYRSDDAVFFGVCGGIAEVFDFAPWGVRLLFVVFGLVFFPFVPVIYLILGMTLKHRPFVPPTSETFAPGAMGRPYEGSRADILRHLEQRFVALDRRLQRLESIVTRPGFDLEDEYRKL